MLGKDDAGIADVRNDQSGPSNDRHGQRCSTELTALSIQHGQFSLEIEQNLSDGSLDIGGEERVGKQLRFDLLLYKLISRGDIKYCNAKNFRLWNVITCETLSP